MTAICATGAASDRVRAVRAGDGGVVRRCSSTRHDPNRRSQGARRERCRYNPERGASMDDARVVVVGCSTSTTSGRVARCRNPGDVQRRLRQRSPAAGVSTRRWPRVEPARRPPSSARWAGCRRATGARVRRRRHRPARFRPATAAPAPRASTSMRTWPQRNSRGYARRERAAGTADSSNGLCPRWRAIGATGITAGSDRRSLALRSRDSGATTILNPAPANVAVPGCCWRWPTLTPNETEFAALLGRYVGERIDADAVSGSRPGPPGHRCAATGHDASVVVTLGASGCFCLASGIEPARRRGRLPPHRCRGGEGRRHHRRRRCVQRRVRGPLALRPDARRSPSTCVSPANTPGCRPNAKARR